MDDPTNPNLILIDSPDGGKIIVNLSQVRRIGEIRNGHCKLWFSEKDSMEITGEGATALVKSVAKRCTTPDGSPLKEAMSE